MKEIVTVLEYIVLICAITLLINYAYIHKTPLSDTYKYKNVPYDIQISNFGSSHSLDDFNYEDYKDEVCFNFAMGSQYPSYDLRIMKNYSGHMKRGGTAYITISYFSFFGIPQEERSDFESKNKRYYDFLPRKYIKNYSFKTKIFECLLPSLTAYDKLFDSFFSKAEQPVESPTITEYNAQEAAKHGLKRYNDHVKANLGPDGERIYNKEEIEAVYEMIQCCKEMGVEPILITTPFLFEYSNTVMEEDPSFFDDFYGVINDIQVDTGVRYYDYSTDKRFSNQYSLFNNSDHLNKEGARIFTDILMKETIGLPPDN